MFLSVHVRVLICCHDRDYHRFRCHSQIRGSWRVAQALASLRAEKKQLPSRYCLDVPVYANQHHAGVDSCSIDYSLFFDRICARDLNILSRHLFSVCGLLSQMFRCAHRMPKHDFALLPFTEVEHIA